jgi:hypothetical protein
LGQPGTAGSVVLNGSSTGTLQIKSAAAAGTGSVLTLPGGTTDFSSTGGTSQVVKQTSAGAAFTVARLACADLSDAGAGCSGSGGGTPANPTASVGLTAVNGSATTYMRSDAAPALSQAIAPTWTAQHIFSQATTIASATAATLDDVKVAAATTTITGNTGSPITRLAKTGLYRPTMTDSSAVTVTDAATLYIDNSPLAAGSATITNAWSLLVGSGASKLQATTINGALTYGGVTLSNAVTGTGAMVLGSGNPTITLANGTGLPISTGVSGLGTGVATFLATPSSANLASAVTDETGSGALVFGTSPTISGPTISGAALSGTIAGTPTFTGALTFSGALSFTSSIKTTSIIETFTAPSITSNVLTIDLTQGTVFNVTNSANINTFTISNPTASTAQAFTLVMTSNGSSRTQTWGSSVKWPGGTAPTLTATSGKKDILSFVTNDGGTTWYGFVGGQNY